MIYRHESVGVRGGSLRSFPSCQGRAAQSVQSDFWLCKNDSTTVFGVRRAGLHGVLQIFSVTRCTALANCLIFRAVGASLEEPVGSECTKHSVAHVPSVSQSDKRTICTLGWVAYARQPGCGSAFQASRHCALDCGSLGIFDCVLLLIRQRMSTPSAVTQ